MENLSQAHISQVLQELWPVGVCAVALLLLLLRDVYIALKRRAPWAPGQALVLTALAIQVLDFTHDSDISYLGSKHQRNQQAVILVREDQLLFDCARLMMCVFLAYLLPAVVSSKMRSDIRVLVLGILLHMVFDVYSVLKVINKPSFGMPNSRQSVWFIVSNATLFTANLLMLTLLSCAVSAGECIRPYLLRKVHWVLSCCSTSTSAVISSLEECKNSCCSDSDNWCCSENTDRCVNTVDHVLKCLIVARVSQPENIRGRSIYSSLAGVIVTIAVVIVVVKWSCIQLPLHYGIGHTLTVFIEMAFILVGWMVISFRWLTAVLYFPERPELLQKREDFWTQSIVELLAGDLDAQYKKKMMMEKIIKQRKPGHRVILNLITEARFYCKRKRIWLQILIVSLSKACWGLSQKLMGMIRPFIMITQNRLYGSSWRQEREQFYKFQNTLNFIRMPGEMAHNLWRANEMAFRRTECKIKEGTEKGTANGEDSLKLIQLIHEKQSPVDKYFKLKKEDEIYFNKMSFKKRGASLMYCMVHLYEHSNNFEGINGATRDNIMNTDIKSAVDMAYGMGRLIDHAMEACSDAWDLLDFLDSSDNVGADREFDTLRNMWQKHFGNLKKLKEDIQELAERHIENRERSAQPGATGERQKWHDSLQNWQGSKDWMNLTVHCDSYKKLYKKFHSSKNAQVDDKENAQVDDEEHEENSIMNAQVDDKEQHEENKKDLENLIRILASVIRDCLEKELDKVLIEKCNNWAEEGKEEEIYNAAFIAGKAKGLTKSLEGTVNPVFSHGSAGISQSPKSSQGSPQFEK